MVSYFEGAKQFHVQHLLINQPSHTLGPLNAIEKLSEFSSKGAGHNSQERYPFPQCYPGTQEGIVNDIRAWFTGSSAEQPIIWLYGPTGMGKTTVAQKIAQEIEQQDKLAGSFFFSRSSPERSDSSKFVATLALHMALKIPHLKPLIEDALQKDPTIFSKAPPAQLEKLIIQPLQSLQFPEGARWLLIVDGLDECLGPPGSDREQEQELVLNLLLSLLSYSFPLSILLCSRAEEWLKAAFDDEPFSTIAVRLPLFFTSRLNEDIWHFVDKEFERISYSPHHAKAMRSVQKPWPPMDIRRLLVNKACGQFIYVATAVRFIDNRWATPQVQLKKLLTSISQPGDGSQIFSALDMLYVHILKSCPNKEAMALSLGEAMCVHVMRDCDVWAVLDQMFGRSEGETYCALRGVHSLIDVQNLDRREKIVYHSSFQDFITCRARALEFFVDIPLTHSRLLCRCLKMLELEAYDSDAYKYAFTAWRHYHLSAAVITEELVDCLLKFDFKRWFVRNCVANPGAPVHWFPRLATWVWDCGLFQQWQLDTIPAASCSLRTKAVRCAERFRTSYDATMVWFLDNDIAHQGGRYKRIIDGCFLPITRSLEADSPLFSVVLLEGSSLEFSIPGEPSIADFVEQDLCRAWSSYAVPNADPPYDAGEVAWGIQFHVFPPSMLAFLADESRSKHHCHISQKRIRSILRGMLENTSGLQRIVEYVRCPSRVVVSLGAGGLPFSPWFEVLALFVELAQEWNAIGDMLKEHGPMVLGVLDALGYYRTQMRFKRAAAKHLPEGWQIRHEKLLSN